MRSLACLVLLALLPTTSASAEPKKLTLVEVMAKAIAGPRAQMAAGDVDAAEARVHEADAARLPRVKLQAYGTISPEIRCDNPECTTTSPKNFALRFSGLYGNAQLDITEPLYTFGKISHARAAARAGVAAQEALADEAAGDIAVDAARAYWGVKVARELGAMLDDGIEQIDHALADMEDKGDKGGKKGGGGLSIQDRQRVAVLLAEAKAQRAEAASAEGQALAGLRALIGVADGDIDDDPLKPIERELPKTVAPDKRPQTLAAKAGAVAADELAALEEANYWPDFAIVASGVYSKAQGTDDPPSAFAADPYNRYGAGVVLGMQWTIEPWNTKARADRARAEAHKAHAQANLAALGARYDADSAVAEARGAKDKVDAAATGEKAAKTWLASVLQAQAVGVAESRDLADSYIAWFQMRARWAASVLQWNVAVVRLGRATGEFRAGVQRPKEK